MKRKVTENDFRVPEFRDKSIDDYEFRSDGKVVRKDRWETGIRRIASILEFNDFEVCDVVKEVEMRHKINARLEIAIMDIIDADYDADALHGAAEKFYETAFKAFTINKAMKASNKNQSNPCESGA